MRGNPFPCGGCERMVRRGVGVLKQILAKRKERRVGRRRGCLLRSKVALKCLLSWRRIVFCYTCMRESTPPRFRRSVSRCRYRVVALEMRLKFNFAKVAASNSLIGLWGIFGMSASICEISLVRVEWKRARCCVYNVQCTILLVTTEFIAKLISVGKSLPRNTPLVRNAKE